MLVASSRVLCVIQREVVGTVARGNANKYTIDAKDLHFQVSSSSSSRNSVYILIMWCIFQIPEAVQHLYEAKLREVHMCVQSIRPLLRLTVQHFD